MQDLTSAADWNDVVRLRGWTWPGAAPPSEGELDILVQAWRREAERSLECGVVRRELCQTTLAAGTATDGAAPPASRFLFVEFALLVPELADPDRPDRAPEMTASLVETSGLFRLDFRLEATSPVSTREVAFDFLDLPGPAGARQGALMAWPARARARHGGEAALLCEALSSNHAFHAFARRRSAPTSARDGEPHRIVAEVAHAERPPRPAMQAVRYHHYGAPEVLRLETVAAPRPGPGQVRVRVRAAAVNRLDATMRSGRVEGNFPPWFPDTPGHAFAGVIEEVGAGVVERRVGEDVYGATSPMLRRAYAEHVVVSSAVVHPKPRNLGFAEAAASVSVVTTAWAALFGRAGLKAGHRILVHGGAGAVGAYAIQLARTLGAEVVTTASAPNRERLLGLGAAQVIDYRAERFEELSGEVDFVLDSQGGETRERSWALIRPGGIMATLLRPEPDPRRAEERGVHAFVVFGHPDIGAVLPEITRRFEEGLLEAAAVSRTFPLMEAALAHAFMEESTSSERIVLQVS